MDYTKEDMENCFTAGVKFARDMFNNPSNTEYMIQVEREKKAKNNIDVIKSVCDHENYRAGHSPFVPCICNDCGEEL